MDLAQRKLHRQVTSPGDCQKLCKYVDNHCESYTFDGSEVKGLKCRLKTKEGDPNLSNDKFDAPKEMPWAWSSKAISGPKSCSKSS